MQDRTFFRKVSGRMLFKDGPHFKLKLGPLRYIGEDRRNLSRNVGFKNMTRHLMVIGKMAASRLRHGILSNAILQGIRRLIHTVNIMSTVIFRMMWQLGINLRKSGCRAVRNVLNQRNCSARFNSDGARRWNLDPAISAVQQGFGETLLSRPHNMIHCNQTGMMQVLAVMSNPGKMQNTLTSDRNWNLDDPAINLGVDKGLYSGTLLMENRVQQDQAFS
jgi:hypothetical protein